MIVRKAALPFLPFLLVATLAARPAAAENPNQAFAGRIMMSPKRFPQSAKSASAYTAAIRKQAQSSFAEDKESHAWKIYFAAFLKVPLNDLEYAVKIYELGAKGQKLLVSFDQFTNERGQQSLVSNMTLDKQTVGVNKELMMTVENKGKVLASSKFKVLGEGEKFSGKVDFSEDDAKGKGDD
jgi:hypothetical protein